MEGMEKQFLLPETWECKNSDCLSKNNYSENFLNKIGFNLMTHKCIINSTAL